MTSSARRPRPGRGRAARRARRHEAAPVPTTEGNIDYDVSYDETVARAYDDGYDPQAAAQFEDSLAPYGEWVDDDAYGRVCSRRWRRWGMTFRPTTAAVTGR